MAWQRLLRKIPGGFSGQKLNMNAPLKRQPRPEPPVCVRGVGAGTVLDVSWSSPSTSLLGELRHTISRWWLQGWKPEVWSLPDRMEMVWGFKNRGYLAWRRENGRK